MTDLYGGQCPAYCPGEEGGGFGGNGCGPAMLFAALIAALIVYLIMNKDSFTGKRRKARMLNSGMPQSTWLGSTPQFQTLTGPISYNRAAPALMMAPYQLDNYMNTVYPPRTTKFTKGHDGHGCCAVSSVNNCPDDLYYKCNQQTWSKEAIGEALALSSVGSYYLPSGVEEENFHKIVALSHDPTTANCQNAAGLPCYSASNPCLAAPKPTCGA